MANTINLDAYFARIGYEGERAPTLETLAAINLRHVQAIPFENLNPFLGLPVKLDIESLQEKMVRNRRGGYCYEHNILFSRMLKELGFQVKWLAARVLWQMPVDSVTARTHMALLVTIGAIDYLSDIAFGGVAMTTPIRFETDIDQTTSHGDYRLSKLGDMFLHQAKIRDEWLPLHRFDLQEPLLPDFEVTNWYLSNNPESRFVTGILAARVDRDCRYTLLNNILSVYYVNGQTEKHTIETVGELRKTLEEVIQITLPDVRDMDAKFQRLIDSAEAP